MRSGEQIRTVGIVGVGAIGASWAAQVTGLGLDLVVHDVAEDPERLLRQAFDRIGPDYPAGRIRFVAGLSALAAASDLVIGAGPENVELKQTMVAELDAHAPADVVLTSSTSGISPTEVVSGGLSTPDRVVVAHPFDELLSELEPVTLTYQPSTPSPEADVATPKFEELLEERSGGKIKLEVVYGQALAPYDEAGVVPLIAVEIARPKFTFCTDPAEGPDDWEGRQRRVGSSATQSIAEGIGTFPVSMDFLETFEALQRNTIDCTVASSVVAYATGLVEVAHPINYPTERSWPTVFGAYLAGKTYSELPKTYQQVIFDSMAVAQSETFGDSFMTLDWMVDSSEEQGGSITPYGSETDEALTGSADEVLAEIGSSGALEPEIVEGLDESFTRWESIVGELGFSDEESFEDVPDYYDESLDYTDFAAQLYEETALAHRPS